MQNLQLFLNHQPADVGSDLLQLTFQINNLAEVQNQQGTVSKQFKIPLTQRNRRLLDFPDEVAFDTALPYKKYPAKVLQDGFEIIPEGSFAELNSIEGNDANITVISGNVDLFDALDAKIYDMGITTTDDANQGIKQPWQKYNHLWSVANVADSQTKTEGWIWPVVDYGKISPDKFDQPIDVRYQRPGFFLKTAIELMIAKAGYKINQVHNALQSDPLYPKLMVMMANDSFEHGTDYVNNKAGNNLQALSTVAQEYRYGRDGADGSLRFSQIVIGDSSFYDASFSSYLATSNIEVEVTVEFDIFVQVSKDDAEVKIGFEVYTPGVGWNNDYPAEPFHPNDRDPVWYRKKKLSFNETLGSGQFVALKYHIPQSKKSGIYFSIPAGARFTVTQTKQSVNYGQQVQCERLFPDISQKDLLKDNLQRFGLTCQTDVFNKSVTFGSFRDIVKNLPRAKDWSSKCLNQGRTIEFRLGNYAQSNALKYKDDDGLTTASPNNVNPLPKGYFDDNILVNDQTLAKTNTLFESQFAPSINRPYLGGTIAQILKVDPNGESDDFSISTQPRILIDQKLNLAALGKSVTFTDGNAANNRTVSDVISVPYFYKPDGAYSLSWKDLGSNPGLKSTYYRELGHILQRCKKVTRFFMLSPRDIYELDLLIPIYLRQDGAYFYINKIDSWVKNQPCKVELVWLG